MSIGIGIGVSGVGQCSDNGMINGVAVFFFLHNRIRWPSARSVRCLVVTGQVHSLPRYIARFGLKVGVVTHDQGLVFFFFKQ